MTKYARDEFDRVPETATRQGVHRAVAQTRRRSLAPILVVGCLALAIGLVAFLFLPQLGFSPAGQASAVSAGESATAEPTATPTATEPAPSAEPTASASAPAEPSASADALDKSQPVAVYNGTLTPGLANRAGGTVTADGWILGETGNWGGVPRTTSVIFYSDETQQANAEALGALLGIDALVETAEFPTPLVVVLGPDYR